MNMNMKTLVDALPSIRKIAGQELSMKTLYRVKRLLDKLEAHLRIYDEQRTKIMERCCVVEGGKYVPKPDMAETLEADMRELLDVEIDMDGIQAIRLPAEEDLRLSYADLCALAGLVEIDFEEDTE